MLPARSVTRPRLPLPGALKRPVAATAALGPQPRTRDFHPLGSSRPSPCTSHRHHCQRKGRQRSFSVAQAPATQSPSDRTHGLDQTRSSWHYPEGGITRGSLRRTGQARRHASGSTGAAQFAGWLASQSLRLSWQAQLYRACCLLFTMPAALNVSGLGAAYRTRRIGTRKKIAVPAESFEGMIERSSCSVSPGRARRRAALRAHRRFDDT